MTNVFEEAYSSVREIDRFVTGRIEDATTTSADLRQAVLDTITALQSVQFDSSAYSLPAPPDIDPNINVSIELPVVTPTSFGSITSQLPTTPALNTVIDVGPLEIPDFASSISSLSIPTPPAWSAPAQIPEPPEVGAVVLPEDPGLTLPAPPALTDIVIPEFPGIELPVFDAEAPEFVGSALPGGLQWSEPTYQTEIMDEALIQIRRLWSGGSGIPADVELAIVERAIAREEMIAARAVDTVADEFSLRGFTMPTGMQAARTDQMVQEMAVKNLALNREVTIKVAEWQVENVRFAVQQAIAAENVYVNIFLNSAQRLFEAARFQVQSQIEIYNAQVALYNARMNAYQIEASVFDTRVRAALSTIEVFKAQVEAEIARGQINEQNVRVYTAQVQALQTGVEIFKARMQGAQVQAEVVRNRIEAYKAQVQAYAERIQADKIRFDAYEAQVRGEAAKAGIIDSQARAYTAMIQGKSAVADFDIKRAELIIQKNRSLIEAYVAQLDTEKTRIQSQTSVIQAGAQAYIADTQRFAAQAQAETTKAQITVSAKEAELRTNVSFYEAKVQAYIGNMEQMIRQAALVLDSLKAAGQLSSTLAAGAMAGVNVSASLSGAGGVSATGTLSESLSSSKSEAVNKNYNYEGTG